VAGNGFQIDEFLSRHVVARVRILRSAAWLQFWNREAIPAGPDAEQAGVTSMRAVLGELDSLTTCDQSEELATELAATRQQLDRMLTAPDPDDESE
jgi:hypothetical protein